MGVIILNTYEKLTNGNLIAGLLILSVWFFAALVVLVIVWITTQQITWKEIVAFCVFAIIAVFCYFNIPEKKYTTYYQVTIDDSVSVNKVYEKYKIINTEGKIYTIVDKEDLK